MLDMRRGREYSESVRRMRMAGYGYDRRKRAKRREEWVWVGRSEMRRAATLEDRVVHGGLDGYLASLYDTGDFLSLLV
jgi:hypothetical protein